MCNARTIIDPSGSLFNKNQKYADPLGLTKTAIGDPTGRIRKERAAVARENAPRVANTIQGYQTLGTGTVLGGGA